MKLLLANIQRFSLRDGPGIRTTAFLKGCNLRCQWCHNPETWEPVPECQYLSQKCLHCGICFKVCPNGCFKPKGGIIDISRSRCSNCQRCIHACPTGALSIVGKEIEAKELAELLLRDRVFFNKSGGGVTISGGEPLLQSGTIELVQMLSQEGIHTALDSAFFVPFETIEKTLPWISLYLIDIKAIDPKLHTSLTGRSNELILENIKSISKIKKEIYIRIPVIPNANIEELPKIAEFIRSLNCDSLKVELIPFHNYAKSKYESLNRSYEYATVDPPSEEEMELFNSYFNGIPSVSYDKVP